jgi:hypothetical protein
MAAEVDFCAFFGMIMTSELFHFRLLSILDVCIANQRGASASHKAQCEAPKAEVNFAERAAVRGVMQEDGVARIQLRK